VGRVWRGVGHCRYSRKGALGAVCNNCEQGLPQTGYKLGKGICSESEAI